MFVSLETVKKHLNIDEYFHDDDEYLGHLILVAEKVVEKHIDCDFSVLKDEVGMIPAPLLQSILLFIGNLYQSRESVSFASATELPLSFRYLLDLYMDYTGNEKIKPDRPKIVENIKVEIIEEKPNYQPLEPMRPPKEEKHFGEFHKKYNEELEED